MARRSTKQTKLQEWETAYGTAAPRAELLCTQLESQLHRLISENDIVLGFPIQRRVKSWDSIQRKLPSLPASVRKLDELQDLAGLRVVLQFHRDVEKVCHLIDNTLDVIRRYDTSERLKDDQFGYASIHFIVQLPKAWLTVPTMATLAGVRAEIQVRTLAQHIWAAASHTFQYKSEQSVPHALRRTIYRVSALLETVDLELERLVADRESYRTALEAAGAKTTGALDVDSLAAVLDEILPSQNKATDEEYSETLNDLQEAGLETADDLRKQWAKYQKEVLQRESSHVQSAREELDEDGTSSGTTEERTLNGVYFTHSGLIRMMLDVRRKRSRK